MSTNTETKFAAIMMSAMKNFSNMELAAFNNAIQGFGKIAPTNLAFRKAIEVGILKDNGDVWDLMATKRASIAEVNRRIESGEFN